MKIIKYTEFFKKINEMNDTPEEYISTASQIKRKIDKMFEFQEEAGSSDTPNEEPTKNKSIKKAKEDSKHKGDMTFKDLGLKLESSEISKYSSSFDSLTVKFSDDTSLYDLYLNIDIKDGMPKEGEENFSYKDIKKCFIKFKKYDIDNFDLIGQISKNVDIESINEEFLINLKIELDETFGDENEEEFEIET